MTDLNRREFIKTIGAGTAVLALPMRILAMGSGDSKPNFVFILADDLGWSDVACYGNNFHETPNIDRLAAEGLRFTDAYAACPVCSPTRASILTGKYPARLGLTDWIPGTTGGHKAKLQTPASLQFLPNEEVTIAEVLKSAGYSTGSIGKWHLGGKGHLPEDQGFDTNLAGSELGSSPEGYFLPGNNLLNLRDVTPGEYLTDRLTTEAIKFIEDNKNRPFFLYLSHYAVHEPIQSKPEYTAKYKKKASPERHHGDPAYAGMVQSLDESVGRVLQTLKDLDLDKRTVVFFMSDNGGPVHVTRNYPLRKGKGSLYEGGIREPMIVRYPPIVKAGNVSKTPVSSVDFFPTILNLAGVGADARNKVDGVSLVPLLKGDSSLGRDTIYWHFPHYHRPDGKPASAVRNGDFKLLHFFEDNRFELYNLKDDISEENDLASKMPEKVAELRSLLSKWLNEVGAKMPTANIQETPVH